MSLDLEHIEVTARSALHGAVRMSDYIVKINPMIVLALINRVRELENELSNAHAALDCAESTLTAPGDGRSW